MLICTCVRSHNVQQTLWSDTERSQQANRNPTSPEPPKWSPTYFEEGSESYEKYGVEYFTTEAQIEVKNIQTLGLVDLTFQSLKEVLGNFTKEKVPSSYKLKKRGANVAPILVGILEEIQSTKAVKVVAHSYENNEINDNNYLSINDIQ